VSVGPGTLKLAGGLGALLVSGGAGVAVAADQRPTGAPLNPPVSQRSAASAPAGSTASTGGLVIPPTPVCAGTGARARRAGGGAAAGGAVSGTTVTTDPQLNALLVQIAGTPAGPARRQLLAGLSADRRQQITALLRQRQQAAAGRKGAGAGPTAACRGAVSGATGDAPALTPSVSDAGSPGQPLTFSHVS
jgi:hypothetical protein